jgi:hypothetical protein
MGGGPPVPSSVLSRAPRTYAEAVDRLTIFGLVAVTSMLVCYALEERSPWFILGFSASCLLGSAYGFLQGAWPFGGVEAVWSLVALRRWWRARPASASRSTRGSA